MLKTQGQIIIEYVLLLVVIVALAALLMSKIVQRADNIDDSGFLIQAWQRYLVEIGKDKADDINRN